MSKHYEFWLECVSKSVRKKHYPSNEELFHTIKIHQKLSSNAFLVPQSNPEPNLLILESCPHWSLCALLKLWRTFSQQERCSETSLREWQLTSLLHYNKDNSFLCPLGSPWHLLKVCSLSHQVLHPHLFTACFCSLFSSAFNITRASNGCYLRYKSSP